MRALFVSVFVSIAAFAPACMAALPPSSELERCMDAAINEGAMINSHRIDCLSKELRSQKARLHHQLSKTSSQLDSSKQKLLRQSQKHWLQHRHAWCRYQSAFSETAPMPAAKRLLCEIEMTADRARDLEQHKE